MGRDIKESLFDGGGYYSFRDWLSFPLVCGFSHRRFDLSFEGMRRELSLESLSSFLSLLGMDKADIVIPDQTQSDRVEFVDESSRSASLTCDGMVTRTRGLVLSVLSADCAPIFFYDGVNQVAGIAHVGWRGLKYHLPQKMVATIRGLGEIKTSSIRVGIGPTIRSCCYKVGKVQEVLFLRHIHYREGKSFLDLAGAIVDELTRSGVRAEEITDSYLCPCCSNDRFYSWRREKTTARTMSVIMIK